MILLADSAKLCIIGGLGMNLTTPKTTFTAFMFIYAPKILQFFSAKMIVLSQT